MPRKGYSMVEGRRKCRGILYLHVVETILKAAVPCPNVDAAVKNDT